MTLHKKQVAILKSFKKFAIIKPGRDDTGKEKIICYHNCDKM